MITAEAQQTRAQLTRKASQVGRDHREPSRDELQGCLRQSLVMARSADFGACAAYYLLVTEIVRRRTAHTDAVKVSEHWTKVEPHLDVRRTSLRSAGGARGGPLCRLRCLCVLFTSNGDCTALCGMR